MTRRDDPVAEPRPVRPRREARQPIETMRDDSDQFCAVETPPVARAVGVEAYRRQVDAIAAAYPDHGVAQARAMELARLREIGRGVGYARLLAELIRDAQQAGVTDPDELADRLVAHGAEVRL